MIRCKACGTNYNVTFYQCPFCGTRNPILPQIEPAHVMIDKIMLASQDVKQLEKMLTNAVSTVVSFHIPFLLHLHDGTYEMKHDNKWIAIQLLRVNEPPEYTRKFFGIGMEFPQNAEIPKDRFGRLAHTFVTIFIPYKIMDDPNTFIFECPKCGTEVESLSTICPSCEATFKQDEAKKPAHSIIKRTALKFFNKFLEAYRFYSKEYHIEPIKNTDIVSFECDYSRKGKNYFGYKYLVDTGSGGIKSGSAFILDDRVHTELRDFLKQGSQIEIQELLLCNAKNHLLSEEYPLAIIEAVSALEIVLSDFIRTESKIAGISKGSAKRFIHDIGVSGEVKVVLKLLTKNETQLDDTTYSDCEGAITLRNNVVHKGLLDLDSVDVKRKVVSIEKMLRYVQTIRSKKVESS